MVRQELRVVEVYTLRRCQAFVARSARIVSLKNTSEQLDIRRICLIPDVSVGLPSRGVA